MAEYPSIEDQAADEGLHCFGCDSHAAYCRECWEDGSESIVCECFHGLCEYEDHDCWAEIDSVNEARGG